MRPEGKRRGGSWKPVLKSIIQNLNEDNGKEVGVKWQSLENTSEIESD